MKIKIKTTTQQQPAKHTSRFLPAPAQEGYINKFIGIIVDDAKIQIAKLKYRLFLSKPDDRKKWEDFERFCKLSRGQK